MTGMAEKSFVSIQKRFLKPVNANGVQYRTVIPAPAYAGINYGRNPLLRWWIPAKNMRE